MSDSIQLLLAAVQSAGALALLLLVPGLTLGRLLVPGAATPLARLGRAAGVSLLTTSLTCTVLAALGLLRPVAVVGAVLALTALPLALRPQGVRLPRLPRLPRMPRGRWARSWLLAGAAVAVAAGLIIIPSHTTVGESLVPFTSTVWYYGGLSDRMAETGAIPATFPEWGAERPFHTDYLPFTAHAAAAFQLLPGDLLVRMELYRRGILVAAFLVAAILFRRWVSTWLAALAAVLLLATERLSFKFVAFKPETFGLVLALFALWAFDRAIVERSRRPAALAVVASAATFLAHAEVFLVLAAAVAGVAVARVLVRPGRGHRFGFRLPAPRAVGRSVALAVLVVGGGGIAGTAVNGMVAGEFRLLGYVTGDRQPASEPATPSAPPGWTFTGDPTWDFYVAAVAPGQAGRSPPDAFTDRQLLPRAIVHIWPGLDGRSPSLLVVLAGLVATPLLAWPWLDARRRRLVATAVGFGVLLLVGAYLLFAISDTYVPRRIGPRRLMPYELLVPVVAAVVVLWGLDRLLRPGWRALLEGRPRLSAMIAAGAALAVLTAGMVAPSPEPAVDDVEPEGRLTAAGLEAWRWIAANTAPEARILTNAYTDGVVAGLGRRIGVIDGRAVYLEDPLFLGQATGLVLGARSLFLDPDGPPAESYLARESVSHVLVADTAAGASGADLGGYRPFDTDVEALDGSRRYTLVGTFGEGRLRLYIVDGG